MEFNLKLTNNIEREKAQQIFNSMYIEVPESEREQKNQELIKLLKSGEKKILMNSILLFNLLVSNCFRKHLFTHGAALFTNFYKYSLANSKSIYR